jgi:hypothetical protein
MQQIWVTQEQAFACCASHKFASLLADTSPYASAAAVIVEARRIWWRECGVRDWLTALAAHPKIGERKAAEPSNGAFAAFSNAEQATAQQSADAAVAEELATLNKEYEAK